MNPISERVVGTLVLALSAAILIFARRYRSNEEFIGRTIAGWAVFLITTIWLEYLYYQYFVMSHTNLGGSN